MEIGEYVGQKRELQNILLSYIENNDENEYIEVINYIQDKKIVENIQEFKELLHLIVKIAKNHYRNPDFFNKIEKILISFENEIKQTFSNLDIFDIFKGSKNIILFLLSKNILIADESFANFLLFKSDLKMENYSNRFSTRNYIKYHLFFYPEIQTFVDGIKKKSIERDLLKYDRNIFTNFEEKRQKGENDSFISQLIRDDTVEEFISYANKTNLSLSSYIKPSVFETNSFLMHKEHSLIEYAAFFGSIQIFQYLKMNGVELTGSLWPYVIHSQSSELIHLLEDNHIEPEVKSNDYYYDYYMKKKEEKTKKKSYKECLKEAIKCHHNDIANYIQNNLYDEKNEDNINEFNESIHSSIFHYKNYAFFPPDFNDKLIYFYLCRFDYYHLVELLLNMKSIEINQSIILQSIFF